MPTPFHPALCVPQGCPCHGLACNGVFRVVFQDELDVLHADLAVTVNVRRLDLRLRQAVRLARNALGIRFQRKLCVNDRDIAVAVGIAEQRLAVVIPSTYCSLTVLLFSTLIASARSAGLLASALLRSRTHMNLS